MLIIVAVSEPAMAATSAAAPDRPLLVPSREASVLYRVTNTGTAPVEVRITTAAGGSPMRVDMPDRTYMLVDQSARSMEMVVPDEQMVLDLPFEDGPQTRFQLNDRMHFTRRSGDMVATVRCTNWDVVLEKARGAMCISDEGVMLRSSSLDEAGRRSLIEAVSVSYSPAPASEFLPPTDFDHMAATPRAPDPASQ